MFADEGAVVGGWKFIFQRGRRMRPAVRFGSGVASGRSSVYILVMFFSLKIALHSLAAHKLRTVLAMLGVFLGALALTGVQHVSEAMLKKTEIEMEKFGPNLLVALTGEVRFRRGSVRISGGQRTFRLSDAKALMQNLPFVQNGVPFSMAQLPIRSGSTKVPCNVVATWPDYTKVRNFKPQYGRFFDAEEEKDRAMVVVLGKKIAERLFGSEQEALGKRVFIYRAGFKVIGVMEPKGRDPSGDDLDEQVFMPLSTYMRRASNTYWIGGAFMQMAPGTGIQYAKDAASALLRERHGIRPGKEDDFSVFTAKELAKMQKQALDLVSTLGLISSSVSFAVGGLGILSIMILLVRSRRIEIGVRRALGAKRRHIVNQFLLEAGLMSAVGGAAGVLLSVVLTGLVAVFASFPFVFNPLLVVGALAGSALIGVLAGAYPAWQAAQVGILDVLRSKE